MSETTVPHTTIITDTSGDNALVDAAGGLNVTVVNTTPISVGDASNTVLVTTLNTDGQSAAANQLVVQSREHVFNGTSWDRMRGDTANGLDVDVTRLPALVAGTAVIGKTYVTDGTRDLVIDNVHNDGESATENHLDVASKVMGLNSSGTFDIIRANVAVNKNQTFTTAQTGFALWTPTTGKAVVITAVQIQSYGTQAGTAQLFFSAAGITAFTRGSTPAVFDGEFAPSATNKPGVIMTFPTPIRGAADFVLRVTTTNAQSITFNVWGYEI